jgi:alkanesulfonate monooxygenase SsuD/methylene tetrahydromethanopterin reductase-like flavin-dependent oxidoreductase (luciferase family)
MTSRDLSIGLALPTMAAGWTRSTLIDWCRIADEGPFSSISCGERVTYQNVEMITTMSAAAALTERVRVMLNLAVAPWHSAALLAKQVATLDVLSGGRVDLGVGVGGRKEDYDAVGSSFARRHQRLDDQVAEIQRLWSGEPALEGSPGIGPPVVQAGGPPIYSGALGPKSLRRSAVWAAGISGFSLSLDADEINAAVMAAHEAWADAGRNDEPRYLAACFFVLGPDDDAAASALRRFTRDYMAIFGDEFSDAMADLAVLSSPETLHDTLARVRDETSCDEVLLVGGDVDPVAARLAAEVVTEVLTGV